MTPGSIAPNATGQDQTEQLNNWLLANRGGTCYFPPTLPGRPYRVAGLWWPIMTRIVGGGGCGPFTDKNPGTYIAPAAGYTGDLTFGDTSQKWSHGTIIEGIAFRNDAGDQAAVGLRFTGGEVSVIRDCAFTGFTQAGIKLVGGSAPFYAENISLYQNRYGAWVYNAGGTMGFVNLGGDDNHSLMCVENSNADPNASGGRDLAINVYNLKVETATMLSAPGASSDSNAPIFRFVNANEASLGIFGGVVKDWSETRGTRTIVHIENSGPDAAGRPARSAYLHIENLKNDNFRYVVVDDVRGVSFDVLAASGWDQPGKAAFMPIYHDHRIVRTST